FEGFFLAFFWVLFMADIRIACFELRRFLFARRTAPYGLCPQGRGLSLSSCMRRGSELSSIDYSRSSSRRDPLPEMTRGAVGDSKEAGEAQSWARLATSKGRRAHVGVVLIHPTKLDASLVRTLCAWW